MSRFIAGLIGSVLVFATATGASADVQHAPSATEARVTLAGQPPRPPLVRVTPPSRPPLVRLGR